MGERRLADPQPAIPDGGGRVAAPPVAAAAGPAPWWRNALVGATALTAALGTLGLVWLLHRPLLLLFAAIVIATALAPIVERLERWLPRAVAVVLVYLVLALAGIGFGLLVVPPLADQAREFLIAAPELLDRAERFAERTFRDLDPATIDQLTAAAEARAEQAALALGELPLAIASALLELVFIFLTSVYWLIGAPAAHRFVRSLLPEPRRSRLDSVLAEVGQTLGGYVRGQGLSVMLVGVVTYFALSLIGVDYPLVLALVAALSELIPIVGIYIATIPAVAIAFLDSPTQALIVLAFFVVFSNIESNIILPNIVRHQADIPPLLAIFAIFSGAVLAGIVGALVAIPLAGALRVLVIRVAAPAIRRWTGAPHPAG